MSLKNYIFSIAVLLSGNALQAQTATGSLPQKSPVSSDTLSKQAAASAVSAVDTAPRMNKQVEEIIQFAKKFLGTPYHYAGSTPSGFDCSGFVRHLYEKSVGQLLPRRAEEQARSTEVIEREELKPGDLVFFNTMRRAFSHVGMYVGDGKFIHAPRAGKSVKIEDMRSAYWQKRFNGARRLPLDSEPTKP